MPRIKIDIPASFPFSTIIPIRITDINYGGHLGNDSMLSLLHEARVQFINWLGYHEMNFGGVGLIMCDVAIDFRKELFYGNTIRVFVAAGDFTRVAFQLYYKIELQGVDSSIVIATAKTGMVCYDYTNKKIAGIPAEVKSSLISDNYLRVFPQ